MSARTTRPPSTRPSPERDLGVAVVAWLVDHRWDVYQEVEYGGPVADIVGTLGQLVCVVELKTSLSFEVIAQAERWRCRSHWQWVAVPKEKIRSDGRRLALDVCRDRGLGVLTVRPLTALEQSIERSHPGGAQAYWPESDLQACRVEVASAAAIRRHSREDVARLRGALHPRQKTFAAAGVQHGKHWSPFQETCDALRGFLAKQGGSATVREAAGAIKHHYAGGATARACLLHWATKGKIADVRVDRSASPLRLHLENSSP